MKLRVSPLTIAIGLVIAAVAYMVYLKSPVANGCLSSQYYCPGVGCVSGPDKCVPGSRGGPSKTFARETFVSKKCAGGTRSDGPCLMDF